MIAEAGREPRQFIACGFRYFGLIVQAIDRASKHPAFWKSVPPLRGRISAQSNVNGLIQPLSDGGIVGYCRNHDLQRGRWLCLLSGNGKTDLNDLN
ncbi:hypothetical protein [Mesorhizobium sp.]|uniref:hypothetical protein n=1 Tax=Mesorhizobium sp. TaxID=1871066 RepID=UPI00121C5EC9|nr:hypothetical protein [Mesorhizobium sp.]TIL46964.1 MAG: hypothetical protein E5Y86_04315 [Mesorhizobium sp.]